MTVIQFAMARYAYNLLELQKTRPLDEGELRILKRTEPMLRLAEQSEAERTTRRSKARGTLPCA